MGKVFVKGPVESPDDLLAKESRLGQLGRVGLDATQAAVNLTRPQSIQSFADLAGVPFNIARYFMEGKGKKQLSPTELAYQKLIAGREAQEQFTREEADRKRQEEMRQNFQRLEGLDASDDRRIDALPEVTGGIFSQERRDSKQALADAQAQRLADYERLEAAQRLPLQEDAASAAEEEMYQRNLQRVREENIRAALRGQKQKGQEQAKAGASILQRISDANAPATQNVAVGNPISNVSTSQFAPIDPRIKAQIETQNMATMGGQAPLPGQPDKKAIAESGALSPNENDGKKEIERVEGMANEQNKDLGMNTVRESINFNEPVTGLSEDVPSPFPPLTPEQKADVEEELKRQASGEGL